MGSNPAGPAKFTHFLPCSSNGSRDETSPTFRVWMTLVIGSPWVIGGDVCFLAFFYTLVVPTSVPAIGLISWKANAPLQESRLNLASAIQTLT